MVLRVRRSRPPAEAPTVTYRRRDRESLCLFSSPVLCRGFSMLKREIERRERERKRERGGKGEDEVAAVKIRLQVRRVLVHPVGGGVLLCRARRIAALGIMDREPRSVGRGPPLGAQWHALIGLITVISA